MGSELRQKVKSRTFGEGGIEAHRRLSCDLSFSFLRRDYNPEWWGYMRTRAERDRSHLEHQY